MKKSIVIIVVLFGVTFANAQNIIVQQNNNTKSQQEPKVVYKEKVVYVEQKQQGPILVGGYLYVYPEKLGSYSTCPNAIINGINKKRAYGKNTWRLPTKEEYSIISASKNINLEDYGVYTRYTYNTYYTIWTYENKDKDYTGNYNIVVNLILVSDE